MIMTLQNKKNYGSYAQGQNPGRKNFQKSEEDRNLPSFDLRQLNKDLFDKIADDCACKISKAKKGNKPTQLRRFYDELVMLEERASVSEKAYKDAEPFIYMIKSKVAYAKGRENVDDVFQTFIYNVIDQISDRETLKNAKLFMEAMMGFYKSYKPKD